MTGISALTAAQLSVAAYTPLDLYQADSPPPLPAGWVADTDHSGSSDDNANQFITFVNNSTHQVVIAFKGSDNASNFESDLLNDGGAAYSELQAAATTA